VRLLAPDHSAPKLAAIQRDLKIALTVWAYEEAANGVNGFRKALGKGALVLIVVAVAQAVD
jgi:hypothetical protein